jgi:hypothetical protein
VAPGGPRCCLFPDGRSCVWFIGRVGDIVDVALVFGGLCVSFSIKGIVVALLVLVDCGVTCLYVLFLGFDSWVCS